MSSFDPSRPRDLVLRLLMAKMGEDAPPEDGYLSFFFFVTGIRGMGSIDDPATP